MNKTMHMSVFILWQYICVRVGGNEQGGTKEWLKNTKGRLILQY